MTDRAAALMLWACGLAAVSAMVGILATTLVGASGTIGGWPAGAWVGWVNAAAGTAVVAVVGGGLAAAVGVGCAVYVSEIGRHAVVSRVVRGVVGPMAGVPGVVYGIAAVVLLGPTVGSTAFGAGIVMGVICLPGVVAETDGGLRAVPDDLRLAARAAGARPFQVLWHVVLPAAWPRVLAGVARAVARSIGETAPLVVIAHVSGVHIDILTWRLFDQTSRLGATHEGFVTGAVLMLTVAVLHVVAAVVIGRTTADKVSP